DCADLSLFWGERNFQTCLAMAAVLFERPDFRIAAGRFPPVALWLLGESGYFGFRKLPSSPPQTKSLALPASGFYVMKSAKATLALTCGSELAPRNGHSHADLLSFELQIAGDRVLWDPGTFAYFPIGRWRDCFRSTGAHNTGVVDGEDQAV